MPKRGVGGKWGASFGIPRLACFIITSMTCQTKKKLAKSKRNIGYILTKVVCEHLVMALGKVASKVKLVGPHLGHHQHHASTHQ